MDALTTGEWIAIIGVVLATCIGVIQILKRSRIKDARISINQSSGAFSRTSQKVNLKVDQNDG